MESSYVKRDAEMHVEMAEKRKMLTLEVGILSSEGVLCLAKCFCSN